MSKSKTFNASGLEQMIRLTRNTVFYWLKQTVWKRLILFVLNNSCYRERNSRVQSGKKAPHSPHSVETPF